MQKLILAFAFLPSLVFAQIVKIQQDPKVDWAGIIELTLPADPFNLPQEESLDATMEVLKLNSLGRGFHDHIDHSLNAKLWQVAKTEQWEMFSDPELTKKLPFESAMRRFSKPDSTIRFDPETYEEHIEVNFEAGKLPFEAPQIRVRQLLIYHNANARFDIITLAIAPCWGNESVPYWLKIPSTHIVTPESVYDKADIVWAVRYTTEDSSPREEHWQEIKNTTGPLPERFIDRIRTDTTIHLYDPEETVVPLDKRACLFSCSDTIVTFDPQTWQEHVQVIETGLDNQEVEDLQLVEEWYWDEGQQRLGTRLLAIAPRAMAKIPGKEPLLEARFYRRCDD